MNPIPFVAPAWVPAPQAKTARSAGADLTTVQDLLVKPGRVRTAPTGVRVAIPEGHVGLLALRSSLGVKGLSIPNGLGVIDSDYRGEIMLILTAAQEPVQLREGDRVAQLIVVPVAEPVYERVPALGSTERGEGGLGSTGQR